MKPIEQLSSRVVRIMGLNPGPFTLQGTNTYLVGTGPERMLIDTGSLLPKYQASLNKYLSENKLSISTIVLTHHHLDHVGNLLPILNSTNSNKHLKVYKKVDIKHDSEYLKYLTDIDTESTLTPIAVEGATLVPIHTPGHTDDSMTFLLVEENSIFSGDTVLGESPTTFQNLTDYLNSLNKLLTIPILHSIYPGHGPLIIDPEDKLKMDIKHRLDRERQILTLLSDKAPLVGDKIYKDGKLACTVLQLVNTIYKGYPDDVIEAAKRSCRLHLDKLILENKVKEIQIDSVVMYQLI